MRIEQRIGRVDRITQRSRNVSVSVIVPENTVEMDVYSRCVERLDLFQQAMGPIQPVLVEEYVERAILGHNPEDLWNRIEEDWKVASKHAELFGKALSLQAPCYRWRVRKEAEGRALRNLLEKTGYREVGPGCWRRRLYLTRPQVSCQTSTWVREETQLVEVKSKTIRLTIPNTEFLQVHTDQGLHIQRLAN